MSGGLFFLITLFVLLVIRAQFRVIKKNTIVHSSLHEETIWGRRTITEKERGVLDLYFPYYQGLNPMKKRAFENRIRHFQATVNFIPMKSCQINQETPLLISATIVMMTFGLKQFKLPMFKDILIFENVYYNASSKAHHKGETDLSGRLAFSQHHILEGFRDYSDNLNLAIHEFAHALHFQTFKDKEDADIHFSQELRVWTSWIGTNSNRKLILQSNYFRKYAQTNAFEMFAVSSECFFETPERFKDELPQLFELMTELYNQNPINVYRNLKDKSQD